MAGYGMNRHPGPTHLLRNLVINTLETEFHAEFDLKILRANLELNFIVAALTDIYDLVRVRGRRSASGTQ